MWMGKEDGIMTEMSWDSAFCRQFQHINAYSPIFNFIVYLTVVNQILN